MCKPAVMSLLYTPTVSHPYGTLTLFCHGHYEFLGTYSVKLIILLRFKKLLQGMVLPPLIITSLHHTLQPHLTIQHPAN